MRFWQSTSSALNKANATLPTGVQHLGNRHQTSSPCCHLITRNDLALRSDLSIWRGFAEVKGRERARLSKTSCPRKPPKPKSRSDALKRLSPISTGCADQRPSGSLRWGTGRLGSLPHSQIPLTSE